MATTKKHPRPTNNFGFPETREDEMIINLEINPKDLYPLEDGTIAIVVDGMEPIRFSHETRNELHDKLGRDLEEKVFKLIHQESAMAALRGRIKYDL